MKDLQELFVFLFALVEGIKMSQEDDKWDWKDALNFQAAAKALPSAVKNIDQIDDQWKNRTPEQVADLKAYLAEKFDIDDDLLEKWIEDGAFMGMDLAQWIERGIKIFKKEKV